MITLSPETEHAIREEGEQAYPDECCGVLLGKFEEGLAAGGERLVTVTKILPIENARKAEERHHRFVIEPEDFIRAEREARGLGLEMLGFYHSHPDSPARPSDYDRDHALPFYAYIILAVEKGKATELMSWELTEDRTRFLQEETAISVLEG
jgi:proteasome lid subunit RPN8/RPN11